MVDQVIIIDVADAPSIKCGRTVPLCDDVTGASFSWEANFLLFWS